MTTKRGLAVVMGFFLVVAACGDDDTGASTTVSPATSSTSSTTTTSTTLAATTTAPPATTTTVETTTTVPLQVDPIEGVPDELVALIGAPMPEPDLTIEGPEDLERWFEEWAAWRSWDFANRLNDPEVVGVGYAPGHPAYEEQLEEREANPDLRGMSHPWQADSIRGFFDDDLWTQGLVLGVVAQVRAPKVYVVEDGVLVKEPAEPPDGTVQVIFTLRSSKPTPDSNEETGQWRVQTIEAGTPGG